MRRKVLLIGWDAADWKVIHPLLDAGKMPNLQRLIENGVMAFMQPGGSKGDESAIETCDKSNASMVLTGRRHFLH